jgi:hypothetical protein
MTNKTSLPGAAEKRTAQEAIWDLIEKFGTLSPANRYWPKCWCISPDHMELLVDGIVALSGSPQPQPVAEEISYEIWIGDECAAMATSPQEASRYAAQYSQESSDKVEVLTVYSRKVSWEALSAPAVEPVAVMEAPKDEQIMAAIKSAPVEDHTKEGWIDRQRLAWGRAVLALSAMGPAQVVAWLRDNTNEFGAAERIEARFAAQIPAEQAATQEERNRWFADGYRAAFRDLPQAATQAEANFPFGTEGDNAPDWMRKKAGDIAGRYAPKGHYKPCRADIIEAMQAAANTGFRAAPTALTGAQAEDWGRLTGAPEIEARIAAEQADTRVCHRDDRCLTCPRFHGKATHCSVAEQAAPKAEPKRDHCPEKLKPGGCQLHNLHCGYPKCNEAPAEQKKAETTDSARALIAKWRHAADHLGLEGLASLADCADELEAALATPPTGVEGAPRITESEARILNEAIRRYAMQDQKTAARKLIEALAAQPVAGHQGGEA